MTGVELRAARERLGLRAEDLAIRASVPADALAQWEASAVPRSAAYKLDCALWELERDAALARSSLTPCPWVARFAALPDGPGKDPWILEQHIGGCRACQARGRFVEQNVRPRPENPWLPPFPRAVLTGAALALLATGGVAAVVILLVLGLAWQDGNLIAGACGLFVVCVAAGGLGGAVYHATRFWRRSGVMGYYASWTVAVEAALFVAVASIALAAWRGLAGLGPDELRMIVHPLFLLALAAAGALVAATIGARLHR